MFIQIFTDYTIISIATISNVCMYVWVVSVSY